MPVWIFIGAIALLVLAGFRKVSNWERAVVVRFGRRSNRVVGPGIVFILPLIDKLERVSIEPFHVSLPPQSAITKDEIPIQLQASLDSEVRDPNLAAVSVKDWRIYLMSQLQELMKEQLEELDFDRLDDVFAGWVQSIRQQLQQKARMIGVEVTGLQISNLSPRTKPA